MSLLFIIIYCATMSSATPHKNKRHVLPPPEASINRYNYPVPNPPPNFNPDFDPGNQEYLPPVNSDFDPPKHDFDPIFVPNPAENPQYLPPRVNNNKGQFRVYNMSCLDTPSAKFFRVTLKTPSFFELPPVLDNGRRDCLSGVGNTYVMDVDGARMALCGVGYCSNGDRNLCAQIRIPSIRGLRLPEDGLMTLQCRPQESVAEQTRVLQINPQVVQGRSLSTVASGGSQRNFDTQVALYRRAPGSPDFNRIVSPGGAVALGEELLLKAAVRDGDGWKFSRMGAVTMKQGRGPQESIALVDASGCRLPGMRSICPQPPRQMDQLISALAFRAFMFQGANSGEEMVLSVRMLGCLQQEDCIQSRACEEKARAKRSFGSEKMSENTSDWQSYLEFKVVLPGHEDATDHQVTPVVIFGTLAGIALLVTLIVAVQLLNKR